MKIEELKVECYIQGVVPNQPVKVEQMNPIASDAVTLIYRDQKVTWI